MKCFLCLRVSQTEKKTKLRNNMDLKKKKLYINLSFFNHPTSSLKCTPSNFRFINIKII